MDISKNTIMRATGNDAFVVRDLSSPKHVVAIDGLASPKSVYETLDNEEININVEPIKEITGGDAFFARDESNPSQSHNTIIMPKIWTPTHNFQVQGRAFRGEHSYSLDAPEIEVYVGTELPKVKSNRIIMGEEEIIPINGPLMEITGRDSFYANQEPTRPPYILDTFYAEQTTRSKIMENFAACLRREKPSDGFSKPSEVPCNQGTDSVSGITMTIPPTVTPSLSNIKGKRIACFDYDSDEEEFPGIACGSYYPTVIHKNGDIRDNRLENLEKVD